MHAFIKEQAQNEIVLPTKEVITLDYLVTIVQLLGILKSGSLE